MTSPASTGTAAGEFPPAPWYKDAIIYELHVRSFQDSNDDGIGDFRGLTSRLDYLQNLGINAIWLLPFYPSPLRDGGYDISDYTSINPQYGTMRDFTRFVREAHRRDIRVITEIVANHTSDQHPWFQRARRAPRGSSARNWYVWSDTDTKYAGTRVIFTDTETSNWAWDPVAEQYYWHRFFTSQPDLNYENPQVMRAMTGVIKFWLDRGVDGIRFDAVPYLCEREGTSNENVPETHEIVRRWRAFIDKHYPGRMMLAEANQWPADVRAYFGDGDEFHMSFHFPVMPRLFMALRQEDRRPIVDIMQQTPPIPEDAQWGLFLRNHDELTLEMVTDEERDYMYSIYATDPRMRINVGIRRRLAPLLDNNRRAIELLNALLFSLPGTPILYYGDEVGMGDNVFLGDRDGVRTPMHWSGDRNAGFSRADPAALHLPVIVDPLYGYQAVNVEAQERSASSLLNWMRRLIALRRRRPAFGRGDLQMLHPENRAVLAFLRRYCDEVTLVVANLSRFVQPVHLDLGELAGMVPVEVIGQQRFPPVGETPYFLTLAPHAFYWFDLVPQPEPVAPDETTWPLIRLEGDWAEVLETPALERLQEEALPAFLPRQRWFGGKEAAGTPVRVHDVVSLRGGGAPAWLALADAESDGGETITYVLPLAVASGRGARRLIEETPGAVIARLDSPRGSGVLFDALASDTFAREWLELIASQRTIEAGAATLRAETTPEFRALYDAVSEPAIIVRTGAEQSNTSINYDQNLIVKMFRRFEQEPHPEFEMRRHLEGRPGLAPRLVGGVWLRTPERSGPVAVAHEFMWSRGDGWGVTLSAARRFLDDHVGEPAPPLSPLHPLALAAERRPEDPVGPEYAEHLWTLGARTAELHLLLAETHGDPAFEPEPLTGRDLEEVAERVERRAEHSRELLSRLAEEGDAQVAEHAHTVLRAGRLDAWLRAASEPPAGTVKTRVHGDYHLGQVLLALDNFVILDFDGEVGLPIEQRRRKMSPFTDIAGMVRSLSYAALTAQREQARTYADLEPTLGRLAAWTAWWEQQAVVAFLGGYMDAASGAPFVPGTLAERERLLDLYLIEKGLHELHYEAAHRPDWISIPLEGLARLLARLGEDTP